MLRLSRTLAPFTAALAGLCAAVAFAQPAPATPPSVPMPDVGKLITQTFSEQDVSLFLSVFRDALQGKPADATKLAPVQQKLEANATMLLQTILSVSVPMLDQMESELTRELRRLKDAQPR